MYMEHHISRKKLSLLAGTALGALTLMPMAANADTANFYDHLAGNEIQKVSGSVTKGGLTASANSGVLTIANFGSEIGLGVCGTGDSIVNGSNLCSQSDGTYVNNTNGVKWNGQLDELENEDANEAITITAGSGTLLTGTFTLGSLDSAETGYVKSGDNYVIFSHSAGNPDSVSLLKGGAWDVACTTISNDFGHVWTLNIGDFGDISSVVFGAGCPIGVSGCFDGGPDNDYLVASAGFVNTDVPIPAAAWLLGSALLGLAGVSRRKQVESSIFQPDSLPSRRLFCVHSLLIKRSDTSLPDRLLPLCYLPPKLFVLLSSFLFAAPV